MLNVVFLRHKSLNNWNEISEETKKLLLKENVDFSSQSLSYGKKNIVVYNKFLLLEGIKSSLSNGLKYHVEDLLCL